MMSLYILSGVLQIVDACYDKITHLSNIMYEAPKLFEISKIGKIKHFVQFSMITSSVEIT